MRSRMLAAAAAVAAAACGLAQGEPPRNEEGYLIADAPREWVFPRDHGVHPGFQTEWWYVTGNVRSRDGRDLGYQFTIFRRELTTTTAERASAWATRDLYLGHAAVTDVADGRFLHADVARRPALGLAGGSTETLASHVDGWSIRETSAGMRVSVDTEGFGYELELAPLKPPAFHGDHGLERKGEGRGQASYYYSLTRLDTSGTIRLGASNWQVTGQSWLDHEFGSSSLGENQAGWDWFSLQLSDGTELMLYNMRLKDGGLDAGSSGSFVDAEGRVAGLTRDEFRIEAQDTWRSPATGAVYPLDWRLEVPGRGIRLRVIPRMKEQEMLTGDSTGISYWEGSVSVTGEASGRAVTGLGYVELTGYAETLGGRI